MTKLSVHEGTFMYGRICDLGVVSKLEADCTSFGPTYPPLYILPTIADKGTASVFFSFASMCALP